MITPLWKLFALSLYSLGTLPLVYSKEAIVEKRTQDSTVSQRACNVLKTRFPYLVSLPGTIKFANDIKHWAFTSEQNATCSIEPRDAGDVSEILKIIGHPDIRAPFAVKSGGHAYVKGYSSTFGVQIVMSKFSEVVYNESSGSVTLGVGLTWDQVYKQLEPLGVMVTGGRIGTVGVGGYSLGGGYSWSTDQYGLAIDTILEYELVLPNGDIKIITNETNPDLFFALKGGLNNFGIVTQITFSSHPQSIVYGGTIIYPSTALDDLNVAVENFSLSNSDPRAQILPSFVVQEGELIAVLLLFFDNPANDSRIFDQFLSIPSISIDVKSRTFTDLIHSFDAGSSINSMGYTDQVVPITKYTAPVLNEIITQAVVIEKRIRNRYSTINFTVVASVEPFINANAHSSGGAYPHDPERPTTPSICQIIYVIDPNMSSGELDELHDAFTDEVNRFSRAVQERAVSEGLSRWDDVLYPNYALSDTPLELIYGANVPRLVEIAAKYDPERIMTLTGNFKFQESFNYRDTLYVNLDT